MITLQTEIKYSKCRKLFLSLVAIFVFIFYGSVPSYAEENVRITPTVKVVQNWADSVVNISTEQVAFLRQDPFWGRSYGSALDAVHQQFFKGPVIGTVKLNSIGSGVIIDKEGLVLTNAHVVNMAKKIFVILHDQTKIEGTAVAVSKEFDLALIQITPPYPLKPMKLANPEDVLIGETVVAIGNPLGLQSSVSQGVVSGTHRNVALPGNKHVFEDLIQTDAAINIGNSGGALINLEGQLVGLNLAIVSNAQNIGFAISSRKIQDFLNKFLEIK